MRTEEDFIGKLELPEEALYGIHALRAKNNFPDLTPFPLEWYKALGFVKQSCYLTGKQFGHAARERYGKKGLPITLPDDKILDYLIEASAEVIAGKHFENFIVPAISGGAGTSINMNVNEIIANVALMKAGHKPGNYKVIDPIEHANLFQSTNDVVPTALKVAIMLLLNKLETVINQLRTEVERLEQAYRDVLRIGYTQMQEAVPSSFGKLFSAYSEALSRDWWRVSKCFERIKVVNLGGSAIGTGLAVPRFFIMEVVPTLQKLTGLPVTRGENLSDTTSNQDAFVEVHATLKSHAVNLEKMVSDLRMLGSDLSGTPVLNLPQKQAGSSIMPGKVNPVIPEFVVSSAQRIYSNDNLITNLCAQGCLELNAYLPAIGHAMIESLKLLIAMGSILKENLLKDLTVNVEISIKRLMQSPAISTALLPYIGYHKAGELAKLMKTKGLDIFHANQELDLLPEQKLHQILKPDNLLKLGYSLNDLSDE
ncbi:MAG: aspartate ammonia-lyase [Bacteroidales bacterium]|nr:aspartate ammonia-lyase [Bacteroidales bacterium]